MSLYEAVGNRCRQSGSTGETRTLPESGINGRDWFGNIMTEFDPGKGEEFTSDEVRCEAPVFVGRKNIIDAIEHRCRNARAVAQQGGKARNGIFLIQRAPGAGQSALFAPLEQEWVDGGEDRYWPPVARFVDDAVRAASPVTVTWKIANFNRTRKWSRHSAR